MKPRHVYVFLGMRNHDFFAVEAANSDEALKACLASKAWEWTEIVYLGRLEGPENRGIMRDKWDGDGTGIHEPAAAYG